jgi:hypothetical protein
VIKGVRKRELDLKAEPHWELNPMKALQGRTVNDEKNKDFPPASLIRAICLWVCGRVHFPTDLVGQVKKDDEDFVVFRQAIVDTLEENPDRTGAILKVTIT